MERSAALEALYAGDVETARRLLPEDSELHVFEAAAFGRVERLEQLVREDPALATAFSADGFTALHLAVFGEQEGAARVLVAHGADVDAVSTGGIARVAPLGTAAFVHSVQLATLLLDLGADPNGGEEGGFTALHSAAQSGDEPLVRLLLERGADPQRATEDGTRPIDLARSDDVRRLLAAGSDGFVATAPDIVATAADAAGASRPPLVVVERLEAFLDERGLGAGPLSVRRIGDGGGSNFSFLVERGEERFVLRRPPRPPLPPSAHDMVREARLQLALAPHGIRLPPILAVCEDAAVLGVPFYVMRFLDGHVITGALPAGLETPESRRRLGEELVDALVEIHAADVHDPALAAFARPGSYLERQVRRFGQLWEVNATRELPTVVSVGRRLDELRPEPLPETVVHGDYRLGNLMVEHDRPDTVLAVLDWEMGAIGDPRADVGYLLATYAEPGGEASPLGVSPMTALEGFPTRAELVARYEAQSGRAVGSLAWFEALALWKAAVFCEAIYGRFTRGELGAEDARAAAFEQAVPRMARAAAERLDEVERTA